MSASTTAPMPASTDRSRPGVASPRPRRAVWPHVLHLSSVLVVTALLTHLAAVLVLARRPDSLAFTRIAVLTKGKFGETVPLGTAELGPLADPALAAAGCLFDLADGPVSVSLDPGGTAFALLAVYDRHGRVLYGLTSRSASGGTLNLDLRAPGTTDENAEDPAPAGSTLAPIRVTAREPVGLVVAQALAVAPSAERAARQVAASLRCSGALPSK